MAEGARGITNRERRDGGNIAQRLRAFAEHAGDESPLYRTICTELADDPVVHEILAGAPYTQPPANLLLGAVQYLLLQGRGPDLARHYATLRPDGIEPRGDPVVLFRAFCADNREALAELAATRVVQTNEVRRTVGLLPAFTVIAEAAGRDLALIEIGASAGLNLRFDAYRYDYGGGHVAGPQNAPVVITTESVGAPPPLEPFPAVAWRLGLDLAPVDVSDPDAARWVRALFWPEHHDRVALFDAAVAAAREDPPPLAAGDGIAALDEVAARAPQDAHLCVFNSFALYQASPLQRRALGDVLGRLSLARDVDHVAIEFERDNPVPPIVRTTYRRGHATVTRLGEMHHHGRRLRWFGPA